MGRRCCTAETPCVHGEGECETDEDCTPGLKCGDNNCKQFAAYFHPKDDCCYNPNLEKPTFIYGKNSSTQF